MRQVFKLKKGDSLINWMMTNNSSEPKAGEFCIEIQTLDRKTHIVKEVISEKEVIIEYCESVRDNSKPGGQGHQNWKIVPTGQEFRLKYKYGSWRTDAGGVFRCLFGDKPNTYRCWEF